MTNEEYRNALHAAVDKLRPYYDIDKVKHNSVYVWTKGDDGDNVFDIHKDNVIFYDANHVIPDDVIPIIREIQTRLM